MRFESLLVGVVGVLLGGVLSADERWWDVVPASESGFGGGRVPEGATEAEKAVLKQVKFEEWVEYEDAFVSFRYPKHPLIKFEVDKPEEGLKVEGGVCTTVDNGYQQAYVLKVGGATYGVFLLNPAKWLDDGICFCGPMVHHAYKLREGTVTRFSMLPGGAVKKAQVVGGGLRMMAFEWTHLACPRSVYEEMVASMRIKTHEAGGDTALRKELFAKYGKDGEIGLIPKGAEMKELVTIFGEPKKKEENVWKWAWNGEEYPCSLSVRVKGGKLDFLENNGIVRDRDHPLKGSLAWCEKLLEDEDGLKKLSEEVISELNTVITKSLLEYSRRKGADQYQWSRALSAASDFDERFKKTDPAWVELVMARGVADWRALDYVEKYGGDSFGPWIWGVWTKAVADSDLLKVYSFDELQDLGKSAAKYDSKAFGEQSEAWWKKGNDDVRVGLLAGAEDGLDGKLVEEWAFEVLSKQLDKDNGRVMFSMMQALAKVKIEEKAELLKLVEKLPAGRDGGDWFEVREFAIEQLGGVVEKEEDKDE